MEHDVNYSDEVRAGSPTVLQRLINIAMIIFLGGLVLVFLMPAYGMIYWTSTSIRRLDAVEHSLGEYFEMHGQYPEADRWCDALVEMESEDNRFESFKHYKDYFPYRLNRHVAGLKEVPDNMAVAFLGESGSSDIEYGWNLAGDFETVKECDRAWVLLGNGDVKIYRKRQLPFLRWEYGDSGDVPVINYIVPLMMFIVLLVIVSIVILVVCRESLQIFWKLAGGIGTLSAAVALALGSYAELVFYNSLGIENFVSPVFNGITGLVTGVCYTAVVGSIYKKYRGRYYINNIAIGLGMVTGAATSSIIHGFLMIVYGEGSFSFLLIGSVMGILAGFVLGAMSGGSFSIYKSHPAVMDKLED